MYWQRAVIRSARTNSATQLFDGVSVRFDNAARVCHCDECRLGYGVLVIKGAVEATGKMFHQDRLAFIEPNGATEFVMQGKKDVHIMVLVGLLLPYLTLVWWNFAADNMNNVRQSVKDWSVHYLRFGNINLEGTILRCLVVLQRCQAKLNEVKYWG